MPLNATQGNSCSEKLLDLDVDLDVDLDRAPVKKEPCLLTSHLSQDQEVVMAQIIMVAS